MLTFLILLCVGAAVAIGWAQSQYRAEGPLETAICLRVERGDKFYDVSKDLEDKGAISNGAIFRVGADYQKRSNLLKAGSFLIEPGTSMEEIARQITTSGRSTCGSVVNFRIGIARVEVDLRELDVTTGKLETKLNFLPKSEDTPRAYLDARDEQDVRVFVLNHRQRPHALWKALVGIDGKVCVSVEECHHRIGDVWL